MKESNEEQGKKESHTSIIRFPVPVGWVMVRLSKINQKKGNSLRMYGSKQNMQSERMNLIEIVLCILLPEGEHLVVDIREGLIDITAFCNWTLPEGSM